ncbi:MAG: AmmeMemoRadiSam system protein A [Desulfobacterales bacterium]
MTKLGTTNTLSHENGQCLLRMARTTIAAHLKRPVADADRRAIEEALGDPIFSSACGTFVTLKKDGHLRGCIGSLSSTVPLAENIRQNAVNAAFHDPRFPPLELDELDLILLEVSILTAPERLEYADADDLLALLRPGTDGVILRKGSASATFLPQVWKQLPRRQDFLSHLCLKAGLKSQAWREGDLQVQTYQVQSFKETKTP